MLANKLASKKISFQVSFQRFAAAFFAISERRSADKFAFRALAPASPDFVFLDGGRVSSISPVAILATMIAAAAVSAGRFCPCGPFGITASPKLLRLIIATVAIIKTGFHGDNFKLRHYRNLINTPGGNNPDPKPLPLVRALAA
jgi:hypothetical protein